MIFKTILLIAFFVGATVSAQNHELRFDHLALEDGLSSNTVYSILQDSRGFMWFGTSEGLNRYDGYGFKAYRNNPYDTSTISDNFVWFESLGEDRDGMIWVGTKGAGLNRFDPITETFKRFQHDLNDPSSLSSNNSLSIWVDQFGVLWVGTDLGLNRFDHETETFAHFQHDPNNISSLGHNSIWEIFETGQGDAAALWIATHNGLDRFIPDIGEFEHMNLDGLNPNDGDPGPVTDIFGDQRGTLWLGSVFGLVRLDLRTMTKKYYRHDSENTNSLNFNVVTDIWQDPGSQGRVLWITTRRGLNRFDTQTETFEHHVFRPNRPGESDSFGVVALHEDRSQQLWIGSHNGGVVKLNPSMQGFEIEKGLPDNPNSLSGLQVRAIQEDSAGNLWLGTEYGLNKLDLETGFVSKFTFAAEATGVADANVISGIAEDHLGQLWLGTRGGGLIRFDSRTGGHLQYRHDPADSTSLASDEIGRVYFDAFGSLWLGTASHVLSRFAPSNWDSGRFEHFKPPGGGEARIKDEFGFSFFEDSRGGFWIGSHLEGLYNLERRSEQFTHYKHNPDINSSLSSNTVNGMAESIFNGNTALWVATENGLNRFSHESGNFHRFYNAQPGGSDFILSIAGGNSNDLWLQNQKGISKFDTKQKTFINFAGSRGMPADMTNQYGIHRNDQGVLFFGGMEGLIHFHPDSIPLNPDVPRIVLTEFRVLNKPAKLDSSITVKTQINLTHDQNFFSLEFAALDFTNPARNQYAYKLEGLDEGWVESGNRRFADYTAVSPGNYLFRVRGSNNEGVWNQVGRSLAISISPPWWKSGPAYGLYALIFVIILFGLRTFELKRNRLKNELEKQSFESRKLREVDELKSRFFANISHEFRTPLTLILGPMQKLVQKTNDKQIREDLWVMQRNASRLQELIDQLLDLSRLDAHQMRLKASPNDIVQKMRELLAAFSSLAESRRIELDLDATHESIIVYYDPDMLEKIIFNLLGNAVKFTPEGGRISLRVGLRPAFVEISVTDTGPGIPFESINRIFERFYQAEGSDSGTHSGTGIGLALTKELVELHHGGIRCESEIGKGSTFTVELPQGRDHLSDAEITEHSQEKTDHQKSTRSLLQLHTTKEPIPTPPEETSESHQPQVLVVEDNHDMQRYLRSCLMADYDLTVADSGESGYEAATEKIPELIVSDVMMLGMDGFELCQKLKSDERTSHIPIILLTARASKESKVEGLETGADDYLIKPFDADELQVRIKNLIEQRKMLRRRFQREIVMQPGQVVASSLEEEFLQKAMAIVQREMSDPDFGVAKLVRDIGMSRVQLHRKLRALTGLSTSGFIRTLRLRRAAELLKQQKGNVAEIAYAVGFNNVPYFHKCFREQFEKTPTQYMTTR